MSSDNIQITEQMEDPESGWTWFLSLSGMVLMTITVVAVAVIFFAFEEGEVESKSIDVPAEQLSELRTEQQGLLQKYERYSVIPLGGTEADAEKRIRIPIEQAMEVTVAESRGQQATNEQTDSPAQSRQAVAKVDFEEVERR